MRGQVRAECTRMYTYTHTHTHVCAHTHTHACTHTYALFLSERDAVDYTQSRCLSQGLFSLNAWVDEGRRRRDLVESLLSKSSALRSVPSTARKTAENSR